MNLGLWLHQLFHVHCIDCQRAESEAKTCNSCENLKLQLDFERQQSQQLLNHIVALTGKQPEPVAPQIQIPVGKVTSWRTHRQLLEERDRETARLLKETQRQDKEIANLEKEVGISEDATNAEAVGGST